MKTIAIEELPLDARVMLRNIPLGETIVVVDAEKPLAEVKSLAQQQLPERPFGLCAGEFTVPGDFDEALPDEVIAEFEGA